MLKTGKRKINRKNILQLIINQLLIKGKKKLANVILIKTLHKLKIYLLQNTTKVKCLDPLVFIYTIIETIRPTVSLMPIIKSGKIYEVPDILGEEDSIQLGLNFLIMSVRVKSSSSSKDISEELAIEFINSFEGKSDSLTKKHKLEADVLYNRSNLRFL